METIYSKNVNNLMQTLADYGFDVEETNSDQLYANRKDVKIANKPEKFRFSSLKGWRFERFQFEIKNENGSRKFENVPETGEQLEVIFSIMGIKKL